MVRRHSGYEPLPSNGDHDNNRRHYRLPWRQWEGLTVYILLFLTYSGLALAFCLYSMVNPKMDAVPSDAEPAIIPIPGDHKEHTIPTPLSLVHPETGKYLYSLNNPLYEHLKTTEFVMEHAPNNALRSLRTGSSSSTRVILDNIAERPTLSLDKTVLQYRDPLTLSWTLGKDSSGNPAVKDDDVLFLYCDEDENEQHDPLQFKEAATMAQVRATSVKHGGRQHANEWFIPSFSIVRSESCRFRLFKSVVQEGQQNIMLYWWADSPLFHTPDSKRTPTSLHLAWTNDTSEVLIQFTTGESGTPVAMYGTGSPTTKVEGTSQTYQAHEMCQEPANVTEPGKFQPPGMLHVVRMTDLEPNTQYQYKVGLAAGQGITWSDVFSFTTAPLVGEDQPVSFIAYGDQGCPSVGWGDGGLWTSAMAAREIDGTSNATTIPISQVHHLGDLSYARGAAHIWDEWFHMISPFAARIPLMVGVGNHEYDHTSGGQDGKDPSGVTSSHGFMPTWGNFRDDSGGECGVPVSKRFTMPATGNGVFWYSYTYGAVHTIMLSSEHDLSQESPQYKWLEAELASVNRTITPWLIVEGHRPLYQSEDYWDQSLVTLGMRYEIEDLLYKYKVDVVLAGHYHSYMRTCDGLYHSKCDNGGPVHITIGSAGALLDTGATLFEQEWTRAFRNDDFGYGRITIWNSTALHFEFVKAGPEDDPDAGKVLDDEWITRNR